MNLGVYFRVYEDACVNLTKYRCGVSGSGDATDDTGGLIGSWTEWLEKQTHCNLLTTIQGASFLKEMGLKAGASMSRAMGTQFLEFYDISCRTCISISKLKNPERDNTAVLGIPGIAQKLDGFCVPYWTKVPQDPDNFLLLLKGAEFAQNTDAGVDKAQFDIITNPVDSKSVLITATHVETFPMSEKNETPLECLCQLRSWMSCRLFGNEDFANTTYFPCLYLAGIHYLKTSKPVMEYPVWLYRLVYVTQILSILVEVNIFVSHHSHAGEGAPETGNLKKDKKLHMESVYKAFYMISVFDSVFGQTFSDIELSCLCVWTQRLILFHNRLLVIGEKDVGVKIQLSLCTSVPFE
jgi:hypothetical protein